MNIAKPLSTAIQCAAALCKSLTDAEIIELYLKLEDCPEKEKNEGCMAVLFGSIERRSLTNLN